jgi:2-phosphosulfolactate phosphatase
MNKYMRGSVTIDCFPSSVERYHHGYAVVAVDVIRATTTAITAAAAGRRCFPVSTLESAFQLQARYPECLLAGEIGGHKPDGFHINNSPAQLAKRHDVFRPMVLLSSSGTQLMCESQKCDAAYVACLRNYKSVAGFLAAQHERVVVIGAGTRDEFREEDQLCCAWIAEELIRHGFETAGGRTAELVDTWAGAPLERCTSGRSCDYLRRSGQLHDLEFVLAHVNDLQSAFSVSNKEVVPVQASLALSA